MESAVERFQTGFPPCFWSVYPEGILVYEVEFEKANNKLAEDLTRVAMRLLCRDTTNRVGTGGNVLGS